MIKTNELIKSSYEVIRHKSGLTLYLAPMDGFKSSFALFATRCGSIDDNFRTNAKEEFKKVPAGIAHFLEHKLFESEEGDAFDEYAKYGANANAFTSFDKTAYLFSCTENFNESLRVLINLVTHPYFTKETVEKEQGIIGQEIKMYDDSPDWRIFFNLIECLYINHPLRLDIAGTTESISKITDKTLYECYNAFYNLNNMVLAVAGNFKIDDVVKLCDEMLINAPSFGVETADPQEPDIIKSGYKEQVLDIINTQFSIGFKGISDNYKENIKRTFIGDIVLELIAGTTTQFYNDLYNSGLINTTFSAETMTGPTYLVHIFSGESKNPNLVYEKIKDRITELKNNGINKSDFERLKKSYFGKIVSTFEDVEEYAMTLMSCGLAKLDPFEEVAFISNLTIKDVTDYLYSNFVIEKSALSVIKGKNND